MSDRDVFAEVAEGLVEESADALRVAARIRALAVRGGG